MSIVDFDRNTLYPRNPYARAWESTASYWNARDRAEFELAMRELVYKADDDTYLWPHQKKLLTTLLEHLRVHLCGSVQAATGTAKRQ